MKYQSLIDTMSLEEKASLMSGKDFWQTMDIERLEIPSITLSDGPHGLRKQAGESDHLGLNASVPATCFPTAATIANSWDPALGEEIGSCLGIEAASLDVHVILGPGLNIKRNPLCGRNFEYFSEDPYLAGKMAAGYIKGIQSQGVAACPKHFAANSQELRRMANDSIVDERTFRELYTTGFEIAVKEGRAKSIMTSYNKINGIYANESSQLLQDILVKEWGFEGFVVSDWGGSNSHTDGVANGSHLEMPTTGKDGIREIVSAVQNGKLSLELLDKRVDELLSVVFELAENLKDKKDREFNIEKHHAVARKAAAQSAVLLKNEEGILPLEKGTKVAMIGDFAQKPRYQGAGSSVVNPTKLESPLDVIPQELESIGYAKGFHRNGQPDSNLIEEACGLGKNAEVVLLYLGLDELSESEGMDRDHMELAKNQTDLLLALKKVNPQIVVILSAGASVEMAWDVDAKAVLHAYLCGQAGASGIFDVVTGKVSPGGKLNESYPLRYEDTPSAPYYPGLEKTSEYREGIYVGYRHFDTHKIAVKYPFGYGLSYTKFEYSDMNVRDNIVRLQVKNTGDYDAFEIVQIYISKLESDLLRPSKELKGFQKLFLKSGESQQVEIPLDDKAFRYYNTISNSWETEEGEYQIMAGTSSADILLIQTIWIDGSKIPEEMSKMHYPAYRDGNILRIPDDEFEGLYGRKVPNKNWDKNDLLGINDTFCQMYYAKSILARLIYKILTRIKVASMKKGEPNLNVLFIYNMPFRGLAKMTGGAVSMEMSYAILHMVNGHFFTGLGRLIKGFFNNRKK
ncbi:MAG: glycoside hydrolase family 3 C-terminal domain-containing protein [Lachnospiraceae bacterium]